jgi:hypothetical protein
MLTAPVREAAARAPPAAAAVEEEPRATVDPVATTVAVPSPFAVLLQSLGREVHQGESLVRSALGAARSGHALDAGDLIALQAGVYRYGEAVDLASRLIDRATTAVKTVLQGQ